MDVLDGRLMPLPFPAPCNFENGLLPDGPRGSVTTPDVTVSGFMTTLDPRHTCTYAQRAAAACTSTPDDFPAVPIPASRLIRQPERILG